MWNHRVLILVAFVASTSAFVRNDSSNDDRIIGSYGAGERFLTYMAQIVGKLPNGNEFHCAGAILSKRFVLTTAVCAKAAPKLSNVVTGSIERLKGHSVAVEKIIVHPEFKAARFENNLALIRTGQNIQFDNHAQEAKLTDIDLREEGGSKIRTAGWGAWTVSIN